MSSKSDGGKGSSPRPFSVSQAEYDARWDAIFQRDLRTGRDVENETDDEDVDVDPDGSDSEDSLRCVRCGGVDTMYKAPNGMHMVCDQCGYAERVLPEVE